MGSIDEAKKLREQAERINPSGSSRFQSVIDSARLLVCASDTIEEQGQRIRDLEEHGRRLVDSHAYGSGVFPEMMHRFEEILNGKPVCDHEWIDPSNEVVTAGAYRLCLKCHLYAIPDEV